MGPCYNAGIDRYDSSMVLMEREEFKRRLDDLLEIISDGLAYFTAWQELNSDDSNTIRALNVYRGFFVPAKNGLLWRRLDSCATIRSVDKER